MKLSVSSTVGLHCEAFVPTTTTSRAMITSNNFQPMYHLNGDGNHPTLVKSSTASFSSSNPGRGHYEQKLREDDICDDSFNYRTSSRKKG